MADDVKLTIGADSKGVTAAANEVQQSMDRLRNSGKKAAGMLEGDRRVENKMTAWVQGFANARDGASLLANTLGNLGDVFRTSLAIGVALNVGSAIVSMFSQAINKTDELKKGAEEAGEALRAAFRSGDDGRLTSAIAAANAEIDKLRKSLTDRWFTGTTGEREEKNQLRALEEEKRQAQNAFMERKAQEITINELKRLGMTAEADAAEENFRLQKEIAAIEDRKLDRDQRNAAVSLAQLDSEARKSAKIDEAKTAGEKEYRKLVAENSEAELKAGAEKNKKKLSFEEDIAKFVRDKNAEQADIDRKEQQRLAEEIQEDNEYLAKLEQKDRDKALADAEKINAVKLKGAKDSVAAAEKEFDRQKQINVERGREAAQGVASGVTLPTQRWYQRAQELSDDKVAGVVARDEARRKFGVDADRLAKQDAKDWVQRRKDELIGKKEGTEKDIGEAAENVKRCKESLANLEKKLGIK